MYNESDGDKDGAFIINDEEIEHELVLVDHNKQKKEMANVDFGNRFMKEGMTALSVTECNNNT